MANMILSWGGVASRCSFHFVTGDFKGEGRVGDSLVCDVHKQPNRLHMYYDGSIIAMIASWLSSRGKERVNHRPAGRRGDADSKIVLRTYLASLGTRYMGG